GKRARAAPAGRGGKGRRRRPGGRWGDGRSAQLGGGRRRGGMTRAATPAVEAHLHALNPLLTRPCSHSAAPLHRTAWPDFAHHGLVPGSGGQPGRERLDRSTRALSRFSICCTVSALVPPIGRGVTTDESDTLTTRLAAPA